MNNKDLLKRFVELAPKEWLRHIATHALDLNHDEASCWWIIFLWDYIGEELGTIGISNNWPLDLGGPFNVGWDWDEMGCNQCKSGKTRIEALVRACVAYWGSKEPK